MTSDSAPVDTRVMIFSSFRDSVQEIAEMLSRLQPVVRVMTFVGHSTGKGMKGFTQKEQLEVTTGNTDGEYCCANTCRSTGRGRVAVAELERVPGQFLSSSAAFGVSKMMLPEQSKRKYCTCLHSVNNC